MRTRKWFRYFFVPEMGHCGYTNVQVPWYGGLLLCRCQPDVRDGYERPLCAWLRMPSRSGQEEAATWMEDPRPGPCRGVLLRQHPCQHHCVRTRELPSGPCRNVEQSLSWVSKKEKRFDRISVFALAWSRARQQGARTLGGFSRPSKTTEGSGSAACLASSASRVRGWRYHLSWPLTAARHSV